MYTLKFGGLLEVILPCYVKHLSKHHENDTPRFMDNPLQNELLQKMRELRDLVGGYSQKDMANAMEISPRSFSAIPQPKTCWNVWFNWPFLKAKT